jgi:hypothetical protein
MLKKLVTQTLHLKFRPFVHVVIVGVSLALSTAVAQQSDEQETAVQGTSIEPLQLENTVSETLNKEIPKSNDSPLPSDLVDLSGGYQAKTVYVDAKWGSRTGGSAKALSKSHKKYAAMGYRFVDMEPYLENSDLRGFFITYERDPQESE